MFLCGGGQCICTCGHPRTTSGSQFFLPLHGSQGLNSQSWQHLYLRSHLAAPCLIFLGICFFPFSFSPLFPILYPSSPPLLLSLYLLFSLSFLPSVWYFVRWYLFLQRQMYRYEFASCQNQRALLVPLCSWITVLYSWITRILQSNLRPPWQVLPRGSQGGSAQ